MTARTPLPKAAQAVHLRIRRVVVDAPAGADRQAIARTLQRDLPQAIGARLLPAGSDPSAHDAGTMSGRIAEAVATHLRPGGGGE